MTTKLTADQMLDGAAHEIDNAVEALAEAIDRLDNIDSEVLNGWQATRRRKMLDHANRAATELYGWNRSE